MSLTRYACTHCGHKFEDEEKDILECPKCFWSSSVKKEEDLTDPLEGISSSPYQPASSKKQFPAVPWKQGGIVLFLILLALGLAWFAMQIPSIISNMKPETKTILAPDDDYDAGAVEEESSLNSSSDLLTQADRNILERRITLSANRSLSAAEQAIVQKRAPFETGFVERLPSQPWTLNNFRTMIHEQEVFYKIKLPGSYKKKLIRLFEAKYVPGDEAFKQGDLLQARNNWVEALGFPQYSDSIQRHRGVALTMLKPFITDTLSKIGAINSALVEKVVREKERAISEGYARLVGHVDAGEWEAAGREVDNLKRWIQEFSNPKALVVGPPPYPPGIRLVDRDIQGTLFEVMQSSTPAVADLEPLKQDVHAKDKVIQSFVPASLAKIQSRYNEAYDAISRQSWVEAIQKFQTADLPAAFDDDVKQKIEVLQRLQKSNLDSGVKSG